MFHGLFPAISIFGVAYFVYKVIELFARRKERMAVIEKLSISNGAIVPPDITKWFPTPEPASWGLRLGLLLSGLGLGLALAVIMDFNMKDLPNGDMIYFALMLLFGGLGLVTAYIIEQKKK